MNRIVRQKKNLQSFTQFVFVLVVTLFFSPRVLGGSATPLIIEARNVPVKNENKSEQHHKEEALNPSKLILDHVLDGYSFHFLDYEGYPISIELPVIVYSVVRGWSMFSSAQFNHGHDVYEGYALHEGHIVAVDTEGHIDETITVWDFSLTRNVTQLILATLVFVLLLLYIASKYKHKMSENDSEQPVDFKSPKGFQNAIEAVIVFVRNEAAIPNLKDKAYTYLPFLLSVFFFILINNLFCMLPGSANVTGNIAFTFVLSIVAFVLMLFSSKKAFWMHVIWPPGVPILVKFILIPVEFLGIFVKPFALMVRLFANMLAGHIIILCFVLTIFIMANLSPAAGWGFSPISVLFIVFIYLIEILVAFIQAYIFTTLTAVFIGQMVEDEEHH